MFRFALLIPLVACAAAVDDPSVDGSLPVQNNGGSMSSDPGQPADDVPFACLVWDDPEMLTDWAEENTPEGSCVVIICPAVYPDWPDGFRVHACNTPDDDGNGPIIRGVEIWYEDLRQ